jgi:hypothetical protein
LPQYSFAKKLQSQVEKRENLRKTLLHNNLLIYAAFMRADPKSAKKYSQIACLFALLGSARLIFVHKIFDEIDYRWMYPEERFPFYINGLG